MTYRLRALITIFDVASNLQFLPFSLKNHLLYVLCMWYFFQTEVWILIAIWFNSNMNSLVNFDVHGSEGWTTTVLTSQILSFLANFKLQTRLLQLTVEHLVAKENIPKMDKVCIIIQVT